MKNYNDRKFYIIGGGIAGLSAAVFLIKDAKVKGENIFIFEKNSESGGSFDGQGSPENGYSCHGYRMFDKSIYLATYDLLSKIPSPKNPQKTLKEDFFEFNKKIKVHAKARLVKNGKILNAHNMQLSRRDRFNLIKLLFLHEKKFGESKIESYFTPSFFKTNFWFEWSTTFAFKPWHSLVEMKRYLVRFIHDAPQIDTMECFLSAPYCEHDFIILPLEKWLRENGVNFQQECVAIDIEFNENNNKKTVTGILLENKDKINVNLGDLVFLTNGSITANASSGSMENPPLPNLKEPASFDVWKNIAKKSENFGDPNIFFSSTEKTSCESFTITFRGPMFFQLMEKFTGNKAGTGGIITFKDSNWFMSIILPHQPYFINQPEDTFVCWGYGSLPDNFGNLINKKMSDCNGKEILEEICHHLGFNDKVQEITKSAICIPSILPYLTSNFSPRKKTDRPEVVPKGSQNFAFIGQYVEIPNEIVFTVECSVRSAKIAVKKLLNLSSKIPPLYQKQYNIQLIFNLIKTAFR